MLQLNNIDIFRLEELEMKNKILPIGNDDFRMLRDDFRMLRTSEKENYYVDKTLLIQDFINYGNLVTLITRPGRFGKTLNMTMLRDFFDCNQDSQAIFEGLAIMDTEYASKINTIPVIYLTFKNCEGYDEDGMIKSIGKKIHREYDKYYQFFENGEINRIKLVYKV